MYSGGDMAVLEGRDQDSEEPARSLATDDRCGEHWGVEPDVRSEGGVEGLEVPGAKGIGERVRGDGRRRGATVPRCAGVRRAGRSCHQRESRRETHRPAAGADPYRTVWRQPAAGRAMASSSSQASIVRLPRAVIHWTASFW